MSNTFCEIDHPIGQTDDPIFVYTVKLLLRVENHQQFCFSYISWLCTGALVAGELQASNVLQKAEHEAKFTIDEIMRDVKTKNQTLIDALKHFAIDFVPESGAAYDTINEWLGQNKAMPGGVGVNSFNGTPG